MTGCGPIQCSANLLMRPMPRSLGVGAFVPYAFGFLLVLEVCAERTYTWAGHPAGVEGSAGRCTF